MDTFVSLLKTDDPILYRGYLLSNKKDAVNRVSFIY